MSDLKLSLVLFTFLVLASQSYAIAVVAEAREDVVASALIDAEGVVASAYQTVLNAEEAGANVSSLLARLNEAEGFLAQGRVAHTQGDFDEALNFANLSKGVGVQVKDDALELRNLALNESLQRVSFTTAASVVACTLIAFVSLWVWRVFKRRYYQRVLGMKPEVNVDES